MDESIKITADQRDLLYERILGCLHRLGDLSMLIERERFGEADRLGLEVLDDLCLVVSDLGWGEGSGEAIELTSPAVVLRRTLSRHCHDAQLQEAEEGRERATACQEMRDAKERNDQIISTCRRVLAELDLNEVRWGAAEL